MQQTRKKPFLKQLHREGANYVLLAPALIYTLIFGYCFSVMGSRTIYWTVAQHTADHTRSGPKQRLNSE